jgi:hypothetical protein
MSEGRDNGPPGETRRASPRHALKSDLIARLAAGDSVVDAARDSGIGWRRAYVWRAEDAAFRAAWDQARAGARERPAITPVLVPASSPPAPPAPFVVPPSPARVAGVPRVFCVAIPDHGFTDYDDATAEPGDKIVCILWSYSRTVPDIVVTYTIRIDGNWAMDLPPDTAAYDAVKPDETTRPMTEVPTFIFAGPAGTTQRAADARPQTGDRILRLVEAVHDRNSGWTLSVVESDGRERQCERPDPTLYDAALAEWRRATSRAED